MSAIKSETAALPASVRQKDLYPPAQLSIADSPLFHMTVCGVHGHPPSTQTPRYPCCSFMHDDPYVARQFRVLGFRVYLRPVSEVVCPVLKVLAVVRMGVISPMLLQRLAHLRLLKRSRPCISNIKHRYDLHDQQRTTTQKSDICESIYSDTSALTHAVSVSLAKQI